MANTALIAVAAQQAAVQRADQQTIDAFRVAGATAPERALPLRRLTGADTAAVERLRDRGLVHEERGRELFWLDEPAVIAERDRPKSGSKTAAFLVLAALLVTLGIVLLAVVLAERS